MISLLIVENDKEVRTELLYLFHWSELNITEVRTAQNGVDALSVMEEFHPDIILCEVQMPSMNGLSFGFIIRKKGYNGKLIYISKSMDCESLYTALQTGAADFLVKPVDRKKLQALLHQLSAECMMERMNSNEKTEEGFDPNSFYETPSVNTSQFYFEDAEIGRYQNALFLGKEEGIRFCQDLEEKIASAADKRIYYIRGIYSQILAATIHTMNQVDADTEERLWKAFHCSGTLKELNGLIRKAIKLIPERQNGSVNPNINKIMQYIASNYSSETLSVAYLAEKFFLNKQYLCALFKKETGNTLNDYIIKVRMDAAKILLQNDIHMYEICDMVGIKNPNYFSITFKKYTGMSPSEYRESRNM